MDAVSGDGRLELPAVAKINRDLGGRPLGGPMQHKILAQRLAHALVRVEGRAEEAAVRAAQLLVEVSKEPER
jgi:hypothetical protein